MGLADSIHERLTYRRLRHYPELSHLPRDMALQRLKSVERAIFKERESSHQFLAAVIMAGWTGAIALAFLASQVSIPPFYLLLYAALIAAMLTWQHHTHRAIRRRIRAFMASEGGRRLYDCVECGYDLRGSPSSTCPECGFDALAKPEGYE